MALWKHNFRGNALVTAVTLASCQAFLLLGFDQGVMAGIIGADNRFGRDFNHPDADMQGNITALYDIGCICFLQVLFQIGTTKVHFKIILILIHLLQIHPMQLSIEGPWPDAFVCPFKRDLDIKKLVFEVLIVCLMEVILEVVTRPCFDQYVIVIIDAVKESGWMLWPSCAHLPSMHPMCNSEGKRVATFDVEWQS
ncbi:hypothetical protein QQZ08_005265 [Neonectria magnoliae]|uniref:Uncharacterized protein n=1 Tax=Neonectria magnoliae TaxID=2732573 RepID=A0ABR1I3U2_9HYPO